MVRASSADVEQFLDGLSHPRKGEVQELRAAILGIGPEVTEQVKWNAPSFCIGGDDRVTFRLQPGDRVELVFHRGAKKRTDVGSFTFADPSGMVRWSTADRGIVAIRDEGHLRSTKPAVVELVSRWMQATAD